MDPHIFADPDPGSQNLADPMDPDPKQCIYHVSNPIPGHLSCVQPIPGHMSDPIPERDLYVMYTWRGLVSSSPVSISYSTSKLSSPDSTSDPVSAVSLQRTEL